MSNLSDLVCQSDMINTSAINFDFDRFNNPKAAIYLSNYSLSLPSGDYFFGDFSITFWLNFKSLQSNGEIFNFGSGPSLDNVLLEFIPTENQQLALSIRIYKKANDFSIIQLEYQFDINSWYMLALVLREETGTLYVNGQQVKSGKIYLPNDLTRTLNYIGKATILTTQM